MQRLSLAFLVLSMLFCAGCSSDVALSMPSPPSTQSVCEPSSFPSKNEPQIILQTAHGKAKLSLQIKDGQPSVTGILDNGNSLQLFLHPNYKLYDHVRLRPLDINGDGSPELLVEASSGGSGGIIGLHVIEIEENALREWPLPSYETENYVALGCRMENTFLPAYRIRVFCPDTGFEKTISVDEGDHSGIYAEDGSLAKECSLEGEAVSSYKTISLENGATGLCLIQVIRGNIKADFLAELQTTIRLGKNGFTMIKQAVIPIDSPADKTM